MLVKIGLGMYKLFNMVYHFLKALLEVMCYFQSSYLRLLRDHFSLLSYSFYALKLLINEKKQKI